MALPNTTYKLGWSFSVSILHSPLPADDEALHDVLAAFLLSRARADRAQLLGLEFECLRVCESDLTAAPSRGSDGPDALVHSLGAAFAPGVTAEAVLDGGELAVLHFDALNFSLEPGGQIEVSLPPLTTPTEVARELARFRTSLEELLAPTPYRPLYVGHQPVTMPSDIELRAKPRYQVMDARFQQSGKLGRHMMRATAGMQVTLDYRNEAECVAMLRGALAMAPLVTAMFANSPHVGGRESGFLSYREHVWWDTDPSRCGVPVRLLADDATLRDYTDFALDAELWFMRRDGELEEVPGRVSFREALVAGEVLTLDDFNLHASTLFPSARLRGGIEVRSADCVACDYAPAFAAIQAAVLYDPELCERATALQPYRDAASVRRLHEAVAKSGLEAELADGYSVAAACAELLELVHIGIERHVATGQWSANTAALLQGVERAVSERRSPALDVLEDRPCRELDLSE